MRISDYIFASENKINQKQKPMKERIEKHLKANPGYFKWGKARLAEKYGCSERTISQILNKIKGVK